MAAVNFTAVEDALIVEHYPDRAVLLAKLPRWTWIAIRRRAHRLGISSAYDTRHSAWSELEKTVLRVFYPDYGAIREALPHRPLPAIKKQANVLGLSTGRRAGPYGDVALWTDEEVAAAGTYGCEIPGRSREAICSLRHRRGIRVERPATVAKPLKPSRSRKPCPPRPAPQRRQQPIWAPPRTFRREGNAIHPQVIAAAARSSHGHQLVAEVQRAVPVGTWPHLKPLVVERVTMAVVTGEAALSDVPALVPAVLADVVALQFEGHRA